MVDVETGEIVAADSRGTAVHRYLPSGTLRPLVLAAAIDEGADPGVVYPPTDVFLELGDGSRVWDTESFVELTMLGMVVRSAALGPALIAQTHLSDGRFRAWMVRFGLQEATDAAAWTSERTLVEATGSGTPVSPSAIARAYAILAHGGLSWDGTRVVSERSALAVREMLEAAVYRGDGTGHRAQVPGMRVGGKTSCESNFSGGAYCSFVGMLPMPSPRFVLLVGVETRAYPAGRGGYAGAAAPDFARLAPELLEVVSRR